jgi:hypothetical protein
MVDEAWGVSSQYLFGDVLVNPVTDWVDPKVGGRFFSPYFFSLMKQHMLSMDNTCPFLGPRFVKTGSFQRFHSLING